MADLLECWVQIKALGETAPRLRRLVAETAEEAWHRRPEPRVWAPLEVLAHLADAELFFATRLRLILTSQQPALEEWDQNALAERSAYLTWPLARALARFAERREGNLELLATCDAGDLVRVGVHCTRGPMTLADVVAYMLAHDTAHVGQIRMRLGVLGGPP